MLQNEWLVWIGHRKDPSILSACPTSEHTSPQVTSAFEILFEIPQGGKRIYFGHVFLTRTGSHFAGKDYASEVNEEQSWTATRRIPSTYTSRHGISGPW